MINNNPIDIYDVNIFRSLTLFKNAIKANCKKWLIISSSSEYGDPKKFKELSKNSNRLPNSDYGLSKAIFSDIIANLAKKYKCKARIMRVFYVFGKGEKKIRLISGLINAISKKKNFVIKNPYEMRDFSNIKFVSNILLDATAFNKKNLNILKFGMYLKVSQNLLKILQVSFGKIKKQKENYFSKKKL